MSTTLETAVTKYLSGSCPARGTRKQYRTTLTKLAQWGGGVAIENLGRKEIREFLDWVYEHAVADEGTNPGRTANKAREHLRRAVVGLGAGADRIAPTLPQAQASARRGGPALPHQG